MKNMVIQFSVAISKKLVIYQLELRKYGTQRDQIK